MTPKIRFADIDGIILGVIPEIGCDLPYLVRVYTFINRDAAPNYDELSGCFNRSIRAGIMRVPMRGRYHLIQEWTQIVNSWIDKTRSVDLGIFDFSD